jgi:hypothetical protein
VINQADGRPQLAVLLSEGIKPLLPVLSQLTVFCRPCAYDRDAKRPFIAGLVSHAGLADALPAGLPVATVVRTIDEARAAALDGRIKVVLASEDVLVSEAGSKGLYLPPYPLELHDVRPIPPFVRARLRRAHAVPDRALASVGVVGPQLLWCGEPTTDDLVNTALACAAVAVVRGPALVRALAWGTPCVTDSQTAASIGAQPDKEVLVASERNLLEAADTLAAEPPRLSSLSREGRALYERRFDAAGVARQLAARLSLQPSGADRIDALLYELQAPLSALSVRSTRRLLTPFVKAGVVSVWSGSTTALPRALSSDLIHRLPASRDRSRMPSTSAAGLSRNAKRMLSRIIGRLIRPQLVALRQEISLIQSRVESVEQEIDHLMSARGIDANEEIAWELLRAEVNALRLRLDKIDTDVRKSSGHADPDID